MKDHVIDLPFKGYTFKERHPTIKIEQTNQKLYIAYGDDECSCFVKKHEEKFKGRRNVRHFINGRYIIISVLSMTYCYSIDEKKLIPYDSNDRSQNYSSDIPSLYKIVSKKDLPKLIESSEEYNPNPNPNYISSLGKEVDDYNEPVFRYTLASMFDTNLRVVEAMKYNPDVRTYQYMHSDDYDRFDYYDYKNRKYAICDMDDNVIVNIIDRGYLYPVKTTKSYAIFLRRIPVTSYDMHEGFERYNNSFVHNLNVIEIYTIDGKYLGGIHKDIDISSYNLDDYSESDQCLIVSTHEMFKRYIQQQDWLAWSISMGRDPFEDAIREMDNGDIQIDLYKEDRYSIRYMVSYVFGVPSRGRFTKAVR